MNWNRAIRIARWEYVQKVRARAFFISLMLIPAMVVVGTVVPTALADSESDQTEAIGVVDETDSLYRPLRAWLSRNARLSNGQPAYALARFSDRRSADRAVLDGQIEGVVLVGDSAGNVLASYRSENPGNYRIVGALQGALARVVRDQRLAHAGLDTARFAELAPEVHLQTVKVSEGGDSGEVGFEELFFTSYLLAFLLMILVLNTGGMLVRSLVEEKSNRIMEILVSSATPLELMWGKLIGLSALGLTQVLIWVTLGIGFGSVAANSPAIMQQLIRIYEVLPLLVLYLALGYLFYAAIFVGLGSLVSTEQEAQVMQTWLVMLLVTPVMVAFGVIADPNATWIRVMSYIPVFTPSIMMLRIVTQMPPVAEVIGTISLMLASTAAVTWACARVFRTAILMTGKRPSLSQVLRWIREPA